MADKRQVQNELRHLAWYDFLRAYATVLRKIDAELQADEALSMEWYDVLITLARAPGQRLRLSEIADRVLLSRSGITRLIDRIEAWKEHSGKPISLGAMWLAVRACGWTHKKKRWSPESKNGRTSKPGALRSSRTKGNSTQPG